MDNFSKFEEKVLKFWQSERIFEKSLKLRKKAPRFVFYEGPPYANAQPGIHHVLARSFKDIILRYKSMRGYLVERRAGWDTHGLPAELEVEKKLGITSKPEIEKIGVEKFIKLCKENIFTYKKQWEEMTQRMGYWLDLENAYITCTNEYIETVWWILKQIWDKGLIYQDYKVVPYCPRCGTSLSDHEVALGYKEVKDPSIYVKFSISNSQFRQRRSAAQADFPNTYFLVWTTTNWTLPSNLALAIGPNIKYVKVKVGKEIYILAERRVKEIIKENYKTLGEIKHKDLLALSYTPLFNVYSPEHAGPGLFRLYEADFVDIKEGTGIVHMAPHYGEDDLKLFKDKNLPLPTVMTVEPDGRFTQKLPLPKQIQGKNVLKTNQDIEFDLDKRGLLYKKETITHTYPFCWRCDTPLLYYAKDSWYIKTTSVKDKMLDNNEKINWTPSYIKDGRFGNWLKENIDWAISRERYWGTPLPIWKCEKCSYKRCIGSIKELKSLSQITHLKDLHKPYIDKVKLKCQKCKGLMYRVPEVVDVWFDSGCMPFAQWHYPFAYAQNQKSKIKNQKYIQKLPKFIPFPADFIAEGIDQTRGWFYTLLAISTLLDLGPSYKNVISLGLVLDEKGQKMSKSKGNIILPKEMMEKYGADTVRFYFYLSPLGETIRFSEKDLDEVFKKFMVTLYNSYIFYKTYVPEKLKSQISLSTPLRRGRVLRRQNLKTSNLLDKWIVSKLNKTIKEMTENLDKYEITKSTRILYNFILEDLSNWYIRRSRKREESNFYQTLHRVLLDICKLSAPFAPFISEEIYQNLKQKDNPESIHLHDWPIQGQINESLIKEMKIVRDIIESLHSLRAENNIKIRQPLRHAMVFVPPGLSFDFEAMDFILRDEINIHEISYFDKKENAHLMQKKDGDYLKKESGDIVVWLDRRITPPLKKEGYAREIVRHIQGLRKELGFKPTDFVSTFWKTDDEEMLDIFKEFEDYIKKGTRSRELKGIEGLKGKEIEVEGKKIRIFIEP